MLDNVGLRYPHRASGQKPLALCDRCPCFGSLFPPLAALTFAASSIICAFGLASAAPRSPYRHFRIMRYCHKIMEESPCRTTKPDKPPCLACCLPFPWRSLFWNPCLPRFWPDARHEAGAFQYCCHVRRFVFEPPFGALSYCCSRRCLRCLPAALQPGFFRCAGARFLWLCSACFWHCHSPSQATFFRSAGHWRTTAASCWGLQRCFQTKWQSPMRRCC